MQKGSQCIVYSLKCKKNVSRFNCRRRTRILLSLLIKRDCGNQADLLPVFVVMYNASAISVKKKLHTALENSP